MKLLIASVATALLAACASPPADSLADCTVPVTRNAGLGVKVQDCAVWTFGARYHGPLQK